MANHSPGEAARAASAHLEVRAERGRVRRRWLAPGAVAVALVLGACSGDDTGTTEPTLLTAPVVSGASETDAPATTSAAGTATEPSTTGPDGSVDSTLVQASIDDIATSDVAASGSTTPPASAAEAPATTADAPPPATGDITETVPVEPQVTLPAVALDEETPVGEVRVAITAIERIEAEARLPGEIAGPALAVRVQVTNDSGAEVDLTGVTVNVFDANDAPASPLTADPNAPFDGRVAPGQQAAATYVFEFPAERPQPVRVEISTSADAPVAVFSGPVQ